MKIGVDRPIEARPRTRTPEPAVPERDTHDAAILTLPDGTRRAYPKARKGHKTDVYHGVSVQDPYRSLERTDSVTTRRFVSQENRTTRAFLDRLPGREKIEQSVENSTLRDRRGLPEIVGNQMFYLKTTGEENQSTICVSDLEGQHERVLFDPNPLSPEGLTAINGFKVSPDGQKIAYGVMRNGTDWVEWKVRDVATGQDAAGKVSDTKFGENIQWSADSQGIFYPRVDRPKGHKALTNTDHWLGTYYHKVGTTEGKDVKAEAPGVPARTSSGDLNDKQGNSWKPVGGDERFNYYMVAADGSGHGSIRAVDKSSPPSPDGSAPAESQLVVPEGKDILQGVALVGGQLVAHYLEDGHSRLERFDKEGKSLGALELPGLGSVDGLRTTPDDRLVFNFSGPVFPPTVYSYKADTDRTSVLFQTKANFDPARYETLLEFGTSKDGTKVPLYVTHRKDVTLDQPRPTYLYGYGGFDVNEVPENKANLNIVPWLDMGGVFVDACLRGGGEFGEAWHEQGKTVSKQNVFDDFIGAAETLIKKGITDNKHLAIGGRSNGGLLAGATELERPDLFAAVVPEVGVLDLDRFPLYSAGTYWVDEYGTVEKKNQFEALQKYSPVHNVVPGREYPSTLIITGDHDDRVVPFHSYKFAATLQQGQGADKPVLLRVERNAGHGSSDHPWPKGKLAAKDVDRWSFLAKALGAQAPG